jgi:bromodomain-containing factor 1
MPEVPFQPVQEVASTTEAPHDLIMNPSSTDEHPQPNGHGSDVLPSTNGAPSPGLNGNLDSLPVSHAPQLEGATAETLMPDPSSSLPASASFESFAPSTTQIETQNSATTATPRESSELVSELQSAPEEVPNSSTKLSSQTLPQESETAHPTQEDKHQQDLANDPDLAEGIAVDVNGAVERTLTPQPTKTTASEPIVTTLDMDTSPDAASHQPPPIPEHHLPSPPPAPQPSHAILPAEQPQAPMPTPVAPEVTESLQVDQTMTDAPHYPGKISRERDEEDDDHGPATKRLKAENGSAEPEFKIPDAPAHSQLVDPAGTIDDTVTVPRLAHMKKVIANLKKSASSAPFREPVNPGLLNIPAYFDIIKRPMDLGTLDRKLKSLSYQRMSDFIQDFHLIVDNAITFNGPTHAVSITGLKMKSSFQNQMRQLPPSDFTALPKEEKKSTKTKEHPVRIASQRRPSTSQVSATGSARSPATPGSATTFALGPEGMPLIRRDSTVGDGRPKRAIHPPKRRDHEFGPGRPRKKKFEWQLKFCKEVINEMKKPKYLAFANFFYLPVDPVALNIPNYHKIVKKPMDMETIEKKLDNYQYEKARDFEEDVRQMFKNCFLFNQPGETVYLAGQQLERVFEDKWVTKDDWLASHEPVSEPQSGGDDDDEDEASEEEDDESGDERNDEIAQLKAQIAMMSQTIGNLQSVPKKKKKTTPPAPAPPKKSGKAKKKDKLASLPLPAQTGKEKKKSMSKSKPEKEHFVTYNEKQYISTGISSLPDARMSEALKIIQSNVPSLKNTHETEIELDIDELPNHVLLKLLNFVRKYGEHAPPEPEPPQQPAYAPQAAPSGKPKKNKPMSKQEQEQQIRELKGKLGAYDGGQVSPDPSKLYKSSCIQTLLIQYFTVRSVEHAVDSSGDDDSEESEEE